MPDPAQIERVLDVIRDGTHYGFDIADATGIKVGALYPLLSRLELDGRITSRWDDEDVVPRRRRYEVIDA